MKNEQMKQNSQWGQAGTSPLHVSGRDHVMGRSQFIDDIPKPGNLSGTAVALLSPLAIPLAHEGRSYFTATHI